MLPLKPSKTPCTSCGPAAQVLDESTRLHEKLDFGEAGRTLYDFFWGDFADWYIEVCSRPSLPVSAFIPLLFESNPD